MKNPVLGGPLLRQRSGPFSPSSSESALDAELRADAVDTVDGVEVLVHEDLEAGGAALARGDDGPGEEEFPDLLGEGGTRLVCDLLGGESILGEMGIRTYSEPALAVLGLDGVGVAEPVAVPSPQGGGVVHADGVDAKIEVSAIPFTQRNLLGENFNSPLNLKASPLKRARVVPQGSRSVSATEDVFVQVDAPDEVLVLPSLTETRQLHVHGTVVLEHVVALAEKGSELLDANVLAHLKLRDLVEFLLGDVAVVHAEDFALLLGDAGAAERVGGVGGALLCDGDTGDLGAVVQTGEFGESTPAAADVEHGLALLQVELLADHGHLVVLQFLEGLLAGGVRDDTAGVDHARAEEPGVVVVTAVVVGTDLLHVLLLGVQQDVTSEGTEEEFHERPGECEVAPVVAVLQDVEEVAVDVSLTVDVHLGEVLDGHLGPAAVAALQLIGLEGDVGLNGPVRQLGLVVDARAVARSPGPDDNQDREEEEDAKENLGFPADAEQVAKVPGDSNEGGEQDVVVEARISCALSGKRGILDGRSLRKVSVRSPAISSWVQQPVWRLHVYAGPLTLVVSTLQSCWSKAEGFPAGVLMNSMSLARMPSGTTILAACCLYRKTV